MNLLGIERNSLQYHRLAPGCLPIKSDTFKFCIGILARQRQHQTSADSLQPGQLSGGDQGDPFSIRRLSFHPDLRNRFRL